MKIKVVSDLHFEFHMDRGKSFVEEINKTKDKFDILVIAGDLTDFNGLNYSYELLNSLMIPVVTVLGNHEYYNTSPDIVEKETFKIQKKYENIHILNRERKVINGVPFCGATLWFETPKTNSLQEYMLDFKKIKNFTPWVYEEGEKDKQFLTREIQKGDIVITHHLPSHASVAEMYLGSPLNAFFVHDVTNIIENKKAAWWVHGHTHESCYYTMGSTQIVANPFGYAGHQLNRNWNSNFIITHHI